jgi:hypothetical protein
MVVIDLAIETIDAVVTAVRFADRASSVRSGAGLHRWLAKGT